MNLLIRTSFSNLSNDFNFNNTTTNLLNSYLMLNENSNSNHHHHNSNQHHHHHTNGQQQINNTTLNHLDLSVDNVLLALFLIFLGFLTVFGNIFVILAIFIDFHLRSSTHYLMGSLAMADLLLGTTVLPFSSFQLFFGKWPFGKIFCDIWLTTDVLCCTASIYLVLVISIDRYIGVTRPLRYNLIVSKRRVYTIISFVWTLSLVVSLVGIGWKSPQTSTNLCKVNQDLAYAFFSASLSFYIPLLLILIIYFRIYKEVRNQMKFLKTGTKQSKSDGTGVTLRVHIGPTNQKKQLTCACNSQNSHLTTNNNNNSHCNNNNSNSNNNSSFKLDSKYVLLSSSNSRLSKNLTNNSNNNTKNGNCLSEKRNLMPKSSSMNTSNSMKLSESFVNCFVEKKIVNSNNNNNNSNMLDSKNNNNCSLCLNRSSSFSSHRTVHSNSTITLPFSSKLAKFKREQKAAKTLAIVVGCFVLCWCPFFISLPVEALCKSCNIPKAMFDVFFWLGYCNSAMNPLIYAFSSREFRKAYKGIIQCNLHYRNKKELEKISRQGYNNKLNNSDNKILKQYKLNSHRLNSSTFNETTDSRNM